MNATLTDHELITIFNSVKDNEPRFFAIYEGDIWEYFNAPNFEQAKRIAREYGARIAHNKVQFVGSSLEN